MRKKIVAANWKMNGSRKEASALIEGILSKVSTLMQQKSQILICPPYLYLDSLSNKLKGSQIALGAQDVSAFTNGAYTGQISATMLQEVGCRYVIVGHSERRQYCFEDNQLIAKKVLAALQGGLTPIVCVGETQAEREAGKTETVVLKQVNAVIEGCGVAAVSHCLIAYEPIWAIGTGLTATPDQAQAVHKMIRQCLGDASDDLAHKVALLYGGSVKGSNSAELFSMPDIDGGLVGGASLIIEEFVQICESAARIAG